jgi:hypothetical protein
MGSGLPQFGFPRRFAIDLVSSEVSLFANEFLDREAREPASPDQIVHSYFTDILFKNQ